MIILWCKWWAQCQVVSKPQHILQFLSFRILCLAMPASIIVHSMARYINPVIMHWFFYDSWFVCKMVQLCDILHWTDCRLYSAFEIRWHMNAILIAIMLLVFTAFLVNDDGIFLWYGHKCWGVNCFRDWTFLWKMTTLIRISSSTFGNVCFTILSQI